MLVLRGLVSFPAVWPSVLGHCSGIQSKLPTKREYEMSHASVSDRQALVDCSTSASRSRPRSPRTRRP